MRSSIFPFSVMFFDLFVWLCVLSSVFMFTFCHCVLCHLFCNLFVPLCVMSSVIVCFIISFGDICVIVCYVINFCDLFVTGCPGSVPGVPSRVHRAGESAQGRQARRLVTHYAVDTIHILSISFDVHPSQEFISHVKILNYH